VHQIEHVLITSRQRLNPINPCPQKRNYYLLDDVCPRNAEKSEEHRESFAEHGRDRTGLRTEKKLLLSW
jgi:hypothetical protein